MGNVGLSGPIVVGPRFEMPHVGLEQSGTRKEGLEVTKADLAPAEGEGTIEARRISRQYSRCGIFPSYAI
jgi:hypothetical protein